MLSPVISFLRSGQNLHPHSNFCENIPSPTGNNNGNDAKLNCARVASTVQWARSKSSNEAAHQPAFPPFSEKGLQIVHATIKKVSI
eukprot:8712278-Ditylum_brightwellii.AAC.1